MEPQVSLKTRLGRFLRSRKVMAVLLGVIVILGIVLAALASIPEVTLRETRDLQGQVPALAEGMDALEVPGATYEGMGFAEAKTEGLECGVSIVFLTELEWRQFQATGVLPTPQLHCGRATSRLPGSVAAVFVENQQLNASTWSFTLTLFEVSHPYAIYGLPAVALLLVGSLGLIVLLLQRALLKWVDAITQEKKK
jgi:hypothetical protein